MSKGYKDLLLKEVKELLVKLPPNVRIRVYYDDMGKSKYTLNQLGSKIDQIADMVLSLSTRLDNLTSDVNSLKQEVKSINTRIDRIDVRLNYNGLKSLPESK